MRREIAARLRTRVRNAVSDFLSRHPRLKARVKGFLSGIDRFRTNRDAMKELFNYKTVNLDTLYGDLFQSRSFDLDGIWSAVPHIQRKLVQIGKRIKRMGRKASLLLRKSFRAGKRFLSMAKRVLLKRARLALKALKQGRVANAFKAFVSRVRQAMGNFAYKMFTNIAELRAAGSVALQAFGIFMQQKLRTLHFGAALIGAAGFLRTTAGHALGIAAREISRQFQYLDGFIADIQESLNTGSAGARTMMTRAASYAGTARSTVTHAAVDMAKAEERHEGGELVILERRVQHSLHGCSTCEDMAELGWQDLGSLPPVGSDCDYGQHCKCTLQLQAFSKEEADALVNPRE